MQPTCTAPQSSGPTRSGCEFRESRPPAPSTFSLRATRSAVRTGGSAYRWAPMCRPSNSAPIPGPSCTQHTCPSVLPAPCTLHAKQPHTHSRRPAPFTCIIGVYADRVPERLDFDLRAPHVLLSFGVWAGMAEAVQCSPDAACERHHTRGAGYDPPMRPSLLEGIHCLGGSARQHGCMAMHGAVQRCGSANGVSGRSRLPPAHVPLLHLLRLLLLRCDGSWAAPPGLGAAAVAP